MNDAGREYGMYTSYQGQMKLKMRLIKCVMIVDLQE